MQAILAALASEIADLVMRLGRAQAEAVQQKQRADKAESRIAELEAAPPD